MSHFHSTQKLAHLTKKKFQDASLGRPSASLAPLENETFCIISQHCDAVQVQIYYDV